MAQSSARAHDPPCLPAAGCGRRPGYFEQYQAERACHIYRRQPDGAWSFEAQGGAEAVLQLASVSLAITLSEIYTFVDLQEPGADEPAATTPG